MNEYVEVECMPEVPPHRKVSRLGKLMDKLLKRKRPGKIIHFPYKIWYEKIQGKNCLPYIYIIEVWLTNYIFSFSDFYNMFCFTMLNDKFHMYEGRLRCGFLKNLVLKLLKLQYSYHFGICHNVLTNYIFRVVCWDRFSPAVYQA